MRDISENPSCMTGTMACDSGKAVECTRSAWEMRRGYDVLTKPCKRSSGKGGRTIRRMFAATTTSSVVGLKDI